MRKFYCLLFIVVCGKSLAQQPQGFFLDGNQPKPATIPAFIEFEKPSNPATTTVSVNATDIITPVSKYVFGNNANVYMSQMVDQPTLLGHITSLAPHVIRFPGGNI